MSRTAGITTFTCSSSGLPYITEHEAQNEPCNTMLLPLITLYGLGLSRMFRSTDLLQATISKLSVTTLLQLPGNICAELLPSWQNFSSLDNYRPQMSYTAGSSHLSLSLRVILIPWAQMPPSTHTAATPHAFASGCLTASAHCFP